MKNNFEDDAVDVFGTDKELPHPLGGKYLAPDIEKPLIEEMEYSDIPAMDDWESFQRKAGMIYLEPDIFEWLLSKGRDFENRANSILRREMILDKGL